MAELTVKRISSSGFADIEAELVAADTDGDSVKSAGGLIYVVQNGGVSSETITFSKPNDTIDCEGYGELSLSNKVLVVAAGDIGMISIPAKWAQNGMVGWKYSSGTSISVGVFVSNA